MTNNMNTWINEEMIQQTV